MRLRPDVEWAEEIDAQLTNPNHTEALAPYMSRWSRTVREALGFSAMDLARKLKISQPAITKLEQNEAAGTISIAKLEMLADALDCHFIYGFVPKHSFITNARDIQNQQNSARKAKRKIPRPSL